MVQTRRGFGSFACVTGSSGSEERFARISPTYTCARNGVSAIKEIADSDDILLVLRGVR